MFMRNLGKKELPRLLTSEWKQLLKMFIYLNSLFSSLRKPEVLTCKALQSSRQLHLVECTGLLIT